MLQYNFTFTNVSWIYCISVPYLCVCVCVFVSVNFFSLFNAKPITTEVGKMWSTYCQWVAELQFTSHWVRNSISRMGENIWIQEALSRNRPRPNCHVVIRVELFIHKPCRQKPPTTYICSRAGVTMQCQFVFVSLGLWVNNSTLITMAIGSGPVSS